MHHEHAKDNTFLTDPGVIPGASATNLLVLAPRQALAQALGKRDGTKTLLLRPLSNPRAELLGGGLECVMLERNDTRVGAEGVEPLLG